MDRKSVKNFKYRLYPSGKQKIRLINSLKICKTIYNELLDNSIKTYAESGKTIRKFDFNKLIKGKYSIHSQVAQNVSDRLSKAFANFFRRVKDKSCKQKGFPRFKSKVNSITFPQSGFNLLSDRRLRLSKIGSVFIVLHRIPKGKIKTLTIKQNKAGQWFAVFSCEMPDIIIKHQSTERIGIDLGIESLATLSNGEVIANPRHLIKSEKRLKLLQRRLSRKVKGSANRRKARFKVARIHNKIANQRSDFLHKLSSRITKSYSFIAVEDLNIKGMVQNHCLAKHISDASWNAFVNMLSYKAVTCGGQLVKGNARNTSKACSSCGTIVDMPLKKRKFICPNCGFACHRDLNASHNILKVGTDCAELNACGDSASTSLSGKASGIVEAGTINTQKNVVRCHKWISNKVFGAKDRYCIFALIAKGRFNEMKLISLGYKYKMGDLFLFDVGKFIQVIGLKAVSSSRLKKILRKLNASNLNEFERCGFSRIRTSQVIGGNKEPAPKPMKVLCCSELNGQHSLPHWHYIQSFGPIIFEYENKIGTKFDKIYEMSVI